MLYIKIQIACITGYLYLFIINNNISFIFVTKRYIIYLDLFSGAGGGIFCCTGNGMFF